MASYPPPPPPPAGGAPPPGGPPGSAPPGSPPPGYGPVPPPAYSARDWRRAQKQQRRQMHEQRRAESAQRRALQQQQRMQRRLTRQRSVVGPVLMVGLGVLFLLLEVGRVSWMHLLTWYGHWWPLLLIGAGCLSLAEWSLSRRRGLGSNAVMGGGGVALLVLLGFTGALANVGSRTIGWDADKLPSSIGDLGSFAMAVGDRHDADDTAGSPIAPNGTLLIDNPHGDITVTGGSEDGQVHVSVHKEIYAFGDDDVTGKRQALQPLFSGGPDALQLRVARMESGHADLQVTVPRGVALTVDSGHGVVNVSEMHAPVAVTGSNGEISVSGVAGAVTAHLRGGSSTPFSAHSVSGGATVDGRGGDINLSEIAGPVSLQGEFFGSTHLEHVRGGVSFQTSRTLIHAARLDGVLDLSKDAPLQVDAVLGPVVVHTRDRVITVTRVQGDVDIVNSHGAVSLTSAAPLGMVSVHNRDGSVELGIPASAAFTLAAETQDGDIENDFGLPVNGDDHKSSSGTVGHGGPSVTLTTNDGDVTLRKSVVEPLAPLPALAPTVTVGGDAAPATGTGSTKKRTTVRVPIAPLKL